MAVETPTQKYHRLHPEKCRAACREWRDRNIVQQREREKIKRRKAFDENPELILKRNREWASRNKDKIRSRDMRRRALLKGAEINLAKMQEWMASVKRKRSVRCYYCNSKISTAKIHFDHIVALAKGGPHSVENLCVSCGHCNLSKQDKPVRAWVRIGQQVLEL